MMFGDKYKQDMVKIYTDLDVNKPFRKSKSKASGINQDYILKNLLDQPKKKNIMNFNRIKYQHQMQQTQNIIEKRN